MKLLSSGTQREVRPIAPARGRGLKRQRGNPKPLHAAIAPARGRGLKPVAICDGAETYRSPPRGGAD